MRNERETPAGRLAQWMDELERFDLPDWESLPQLDLYMDQVILLLTRYLAPLERYGEEKAITASIINNYVRMKVMPAPVKKRYSRVHLAYLIVICTLKQSLSISCIQRLLPQAGSEEEARAFYTAFVRQHRASIRFLCGLPLGGGRLTVEGGASLALEGENGLAVASAIFSTLSKSLTEHLLQPGSQAGPGAEEDED